MASIQKFTGLLGNKNPNLLAQQYPLKSKFNSTYMDTWGAFHDWQLSAETADAPLPFPHQMI